jgi:hypothetical protein
VALTLGIVFLGLVSWLAAARSELAARAVVAGSVIYLASLLLALLLDGPLPRP